MEEIFGTDEADSIEGTDKDETIWGLEGNDTLVGADGDDLVQGGQGNDLIGAFYDEGSGTLVGGAGSDATNRLKGGSGEDLFLFESSVSDYVTTDLIVDFEGAGIVGGDIIDFDHSGFAFSGELDAMPEVGDPLGVHNDLPEVLVVRDAVFTHVIADTSADDRFGTTDFFVRLKGDHALTADDSTCDSPLPGRTTRTGSSEPARRRNTLRLRATTQSGASVATIR